MSIVGDEDDGVRPLSNAERQQRFRERRNSLAASADLKTLVRRGYHPGTPEQARLALAFLLALAKHGTATTHAGDNGLMLQLTADKAILPDEAQQALWALRHYVCPPLRDDENLFNTREGSVDVQVQIAPLMTQRRTKRKPTKPAPKRKATKRKRRA